MLLTLWVLGPFQEHHLLVRRWMPEHTLPMDLRRDMERRDEEDKIKEAEEKKKQERRVRDEFRQLLQTMFEEGQLNHRTKWKKVIEGPMKVLWG